MEYTEEKKEERVEEGVEEEKTERPMEKSKIFLVISGVLCVIAVIGGLIMYPMISDYKQSSQMGMEAAASEVPGLTDQHPINVYTLDRSEEEMAYIQLLSEEEFGTLVGQVFQGLLNGNAEGYENNQLFLFEFALTLDYELAERISEQERKELLGAYLSALEERDGIELPEEATDAEREWLYAGMVENFTAAVWGILGDAERVNIVLE